MKHLSIKNIAILAIATVLMAACGKNNDDKEALIGRWANTDGSFEMTPDGPAFVGEQTIWMEFTKDKVMIYDYRKDCLSTWHEYTLRKESDKLLLRAEKGCYDGTVFVVEKLTKDEMHLIPRFDPFNTGFCYIMKRNDSQFWFD